MFLVISYLSDLQRPSQTKRSSCAFLIWAHNKLSWLMPEILSPSSYMFLENILLYPCLNILSEILTHRCFLRTTLYLSLWQYHRIWCTYTHYITCIPLCCQQKKSNYLLDAEVMLTEPWTILTSKDNLLPLCVQALDHHISTINTEIGILQSVLY